MTDRALDEPGAAADRVGSREPSAIRPQPAERSLRLLLAYDGGAYHGWQFQPALPTIQGELERALASVTGREVRVQGAGRTDAGVHALAQVASFRTISRLPSERLCAALNAHLPRDIRVRYVEEAPPDFAARFSARWRQYRYLLAREESPFLRGRVYRPRAWPDFEAMEGAASCLPGEHDCQAFTTQRDGPFGCQILLARWEKWEGGYAFVIRSNRFLYQMVRILVGSLLEIGRRRWMPSDLAGIRAGRDRRRAGPLAPACGLYLTGVGYEPPWPSESATPPVLPPLGLQLR